MIKISRGAVWGTLLASALLTGCGTTQAAAPMSKPVTTAAPAHPTAGSGSWLVGAAASPPSGAGNGFLWLEHQNHWHLVSLGQGANAFQAAVWGSWVFVPTLTGTTDVVDWTTQKPVKTLATPVGSRVALVDGATHRLYLIGPNTTAAYTLPGLNPLWQKPVGGNTAVMADNRLYLNAPTADVTTVLNAETGAPEQNVPVGHIEDMVFDPAYHTIWMANWYNGDMTVLNAATNRVVTTLHEAEGGGFSMTNKMGAMSGYMQIAVGPNGQHVYAAAFSGNIMVFNANTNQFVRDVPAPVPMAKLSGLAIDPNGEIAYTTVESQNETIAVSLKSGALLALWPHIQSNRWLTFSAP
ncbi:MAG: hypothetical protein OWQ57_00385 [Sulfobacillus sp.]|nr:hypothetical protein [Sulfobacillus sp.]